MATKRWYDKNKSRLSDRRKNPDWLAHKQKTFRTWMLKTKYRMTPEQFASISAAQGHVCAICKRPPSGSRNNDKVLNIDHNHVTSAVRGLLCATCNRAIGLLRDDAGVLDAAAAYLRRYS